METYYLIIVGFLLLLAVSDLTIGVSNDAVNFLNSAIGSKAAPFRIIILVAALGVIIGATFSSGMMEVARSSIFNPEKFHFDEIMILFMAVMISDVLILDMFNTFGMPTSTTVSIVFELLGSSVAVSTMKIIRAGESIGNLSVFINSDRALGIIAGIFLSIFISFTFGAIFQWILRILFSFNISRTLKYWGGLWGGISVTAIFYFLIVKGAKGATFMSENTVEWITSNSGLLMFYFFAGGTIFFQLLIMLARVNVLRIIVLLGTFALAMAFAGNDLVNFIGVPLAGLESFKSFIASGLKPDEQLMTVLQGPVKTPVMFLLTAGLIMAIALKFSRKARSVTATTIDLSSQEEQDERFESSALARILVRWSLDLSNFFQRIIPHRLRVMIERRFDQSVLTEQNKKQHEILAFDLVRASVNLVIASALIALGTSLKLPLSTTYVTFMVAMGTSLSDGAWGRETAVYRITGVITVVGGWFLTAFAAFAFSFLLAIGLFYGGMIAIIGFMLIAAYILMRTHAFHKKKSAEAEMKAIKEEKVTTMGIISNCSETVKKIIIKVSKLYYIAIINFVKENRKALHQVRKETKELNQETKDLKKGIHLTIRKLMEDEIESGHYYVQVLDYLKETANCLAFVVNPLFVHVDNNHPPLTKDLANELLQFNEKMSDFFNFALNILKNNKFEKLNELIEKRNNLIVETNNLKKKQIKVLKKLRKGGKTGMLYLDIMTESKNMLLFATNVLQAQKEFLEYENNNIVKKENPVVMK